MAYSLTQNHSLLVQKSATAFFRGSSSKTLRRRPLSQEQPRLLRFRRGALAFKQSVKNNLGDACRVGTRNFTLNQSRPLSTATYRAVPESSEDMVEDASESLWLMSQAQKAAGLATFLAADMFLKKAFVAANIAFPSALGGMFVILGTLLALEAVSNSTVDFLFSIFKPALDWIARWLPLFYMPSLIVLPVAIQGMSAASLTKLGSIVVFGFVMSLIVTAYVATASRALFASASTDAADDSKSEKPKPAASAATPTSVANLYRFWGGLSLASLIAGATGALSVATAGVPFLLGVIVVSFLYGSSLSASVKKILHPLVFCFLATDAAAVLLGTVTGTSWVTVLKSFLTKGVGPMGAGDFLMAFLGPVILSFGFRMYEQRELMKQNAASMISTITLSSLFGLFATAAVGRAMGLSPDLILAVVPRSITVALALPIGSMLGVSSQASITAVAVVLTGLVGANIGIMLLDALGIKDTINRGMAIASSSHGLGTAALVTAEPAALPFCALAYSLTGIISSCIVSIPMIQMLLRSIAGA